MVRVRHSVASHRRKKKILKLAKGQWGDRSKRYKHARESIMHSLVYAYRDRKRQKRQIRNLWIIRINSACRNLGINYSKFIQGLKKTKVKIDRKILADLAINDTAAFEKLVEIAKQ